MAKKFQNVKGMRDLMPQDAVEMQAVVDTCRKVFESYGFEPIDTPALEPFELFATKGGVGEAVRDEIYTFKDKSGRELALRFEFTASLARFISNNQNIPKPFKRYQIGKVWRYDNPQSLRYREFTQADFDIVGSSSPLADAEIISVACECLKALGIKDFIIRINDRRVIEKIWEKRNIPKEKMVDIFRTIDKTGKVSEENIAAELSQKGIDPKIVMDVIKIKGSNEEVFSKLSKMVEKDKSIDEIGKILDYVELFRISDKVKLDPSLVRGLEYYTGFVFEISIGSGKVSFGGGGRYDNLIKTLGGPDLPATGGSFGVDRLLEVAKPEVKKIPKVFIAYTNKSEQPKSIQIVSRLRSLGIVALIDFDNRKLSKQMEYADEVGADFVIILGEKELKENKIKTRNMSSGEEKDIPMADIDIWARGLLDRK